MQTPTGVGQAEMVFQVILAVQVAAAVLARQAQMVLAELSAVLVAQGLMFQRLLAVQHYSRAQAVAAVRLRAVRQAQQVQAQAVQEQLARQPRQIRVQAAVAQQEPQETLAAQAAQASFMSGSRCRHGTFCTSN
jgi:hypothetical protein